MNNTPTIRAFGERALLIDWPMAIQSDIHQMVMAQCDSILTKFDHELLDVVPTYHSIALYVKEGVSLNNFTERLKSSLLNSSETNELRSHVISIPVCYEEPFALDLADAAKSVSLSIPDFIDLHSKPIYKVYFLGFLPGFPYLGGLNEQLHIPRRSEPRSRIEKGSVGIGGKQTGIYPNDSPGGWNIIGKTPLQFFSTAKRPPTEIRAGDFIKFEPITRTEYNLIQIELESGTFQWRQEVYND